MSYNGRQYVNELNQQSSFNSELLLPTLVILIISLIYYVYKFRNTQRNVEQIISSSQIGQNSHINSNQINHHNNANIDENPNINLIERPSLHRTNLNEYSSKIEEENKENLNNNIYNSSLNKGVRNRNENYKDLENTKQIIKNENIIIEEFNKDSDVNKVNESSKLLNDKITIFIMINQVKHQFSINKYDLISEFVKKHLIDFAKDKNITLIAAGKRLDPSKSFDEYSFVQDQVVIHAFLSSMNFGSGINNNFNDSNNRNNNQQAPEGSQGFYRPELNLNQSGIIYF